MQRKDFHNCMIRAYTCENKGWASNSRIMLIKLCFMLDTEV